ncbi:hypothetical protein V6N13_061535 [Hibiscus sabdariffa]
MQSIRYYKEHKFEGLTLARLKLEGLYAAHLSSTQLKQLQLAHFSSTSVQLAQLKLNNLEAAETRPTCGRVSYEHVDSIWASYPSSMHVHGM